MDRGLTSPTASATAPQRTLPAQPTLPILSVNDLTITIAGRAIVRNTSFTLEAGVSLAIVGPNGCGKSVLLKALLGMLPYTGTIAWQPGVRTGYVPQNISADPHLPLCVHELMQAKARLQRLTADQITAALDYTGVGNLLDQRVGALSGGQLQRVLIAFALAGDPNVLLVDEPTSSLDEPSEEHFAQLLNRIREQRGTTLVLVSHDLTLVRGSATHVLCLSAGAASFGTAAEMLVPEVLERVYGQPVEFHAHGLERN